MVKRWCANVLMHMFDVVFVTRSIILNTLSINISCLYKHSLGKISGTGFHNNYNHNCSISFYNEIFLIYIRFTYCHTRASVSLQDGATKWIYFLTEPSTRPADHMDVRLARKLEFDGCLVLSMMCGVPTLCLLHHQSMRCPPHPGYVFSHPQMWMLD